MTMSLCIYIFVEENVVLCINVYACLWLHIVVGSWVVGSNQLWISFIYVVNILKEKQEQRLWEEKYKVIIVSMVLLLLAVCYEYGDCHCF